MSQTSKYATESLANALYGAPFFLSFSLPLHYLLFVAPSFSFGPEAKPKFAALHRPRGLSTYFSQPVPCALAKTACLVVVTCSLSRVTQGPPPLIVVQLASLSVHFCVCDQVVSRYLIPFIVHLTRIPRAMRVRVEYTDTMYRCLVCE